MEVLCRWLMVAALLVLYGGKVNFVGRDKKVRRSNSVVTETTLTKLNNPRTGSF